MVTRDMEYKLLVVLSICLIIMGTAEISVEYVFMEFINSHLTRFINRMILCNEMSTMLISLSISVNPEIILTGTHCSL